MDTSFSRLLVANRGEIATRVLRAASELGIETISIFTHEDRFSPHRMKADESYMLSPRSEALKPYLDIEQIVSLAVSKEVDAIHPGYGFLSENADFAEACLQAGIKFIGPSPEVMRRLGNKILAREVADAAGVQRIGGFSVAGLGARELSARAEELGFPVIVKAAAGGGGRGMRVVRSGKELDAALVEAAREAERAFGSGELFVEKFLERPKHIEVQLLGDEHGSLVHLFERDCSVQRRFQKVVEIAPAVGLAAHARERALDAALRIGREVGYSNAGTVEFLVDAAEEVYFIEVNPRIQVEHTVSEQVTGIDLVRAQILVAAGHRLEDEPLRITSQEDIKLHGVAIQCRITSEDPLRDFQPDFGQISVYRSPGGFGIRLDGGGAYTGAHISPSFDSLLVKVTASGTTLAGASDRMHRALREFRIRGVKTNILFLLNVIRDQEFLAGDATVNFIQEKPELVQYSPGKNRAGKLLDYLSQVAVNGKADVLGSKRPENLLPEVEFDFCPPEHIPQGMKQRFESLGREDFLNWVRDYHKVLYTDTTLRDAHQSLLATRVRTRDMLPCARAFAERVPELFSLEVWGGATFDVALRFLHECPWDRLRRLRAALPNALLQMLFRGSNGVGYSRYPDNMLVAFIEKSAELGIDVFRIFDSLNYLPAMEASITAVRERTGAIAEVCLCYTGDILDSSRGKYSLEYYLELAKRIEDSGAHMLAIKDMAGLLKPEAATVLIGALRDHISLPIHLHTHDTAGVQSATYLRAIEAGVDVIDVAVASVSGLTSQPNFNSLVQCLEGHPRSGTVSVATLEQISQYWEVVRDYYNAFESGLKASTAEVYRHEIPGGQYSNLRPQARALGLEHRFEDIKERYVDANQLLGDLVKVTPSSKVVGDLALFMVSNNLSADDVVERADSLSFPESVKGFLRGELGVPPFGFPEELCRAVHGKDWRPVEQAPLPPADLKQELTLQRERYPLAASEEDMLSRLLYPAVFDEYYAYLESYGELWRLPTLAFFYSLTPGEEIAVEIEQGKLLFIELVFVGDADESGMREVSWKLNGGARSTSVRDESLHVAIASNKKVSGAGDVGSPLQGKLAEVLVELGQQVKKGTPLFVIEAMKMESTVQATRDGSVVAVELHGGALVQQDDLIVTIG